MARLRIKYPYVWLFCAYASLGAFLYGYDGVYFNGVSTLRKCHHIHGMDSFDEQATTLNVPQAPFLHRFGQQQPDGNWRLKPSELAIMTSMMNVGELLGSLGAAPLNDLLGRKSVLLAGSAFVAVGVVAQLAAGGAGALTAGRLILGVGVGGFSATCPLYMGEVSPEEMRSPLLMCWQLTLSASQIVAAGINRGMVDRGGRFSYLFPIGFQLLFPAVVLAFWAFVPESPRWLLRKGKRSRALASLRSIHREDDGFDADGALALVQQDLDREAELEARSTWLQLLTDPVERRKLVHSAGALVAQQINGIQWFYYFGTVFSEDIGLGDPFLMTLIVFVIQVFVVLAAVLLANRLPRRPLLIATTGVMTVSIFVVGCLGIPSTAPSPTFGRVIISFVIIEIVAFNFAWGPLGWTIASEMAVGRNRNKIYAVAVACFWVTVWVTVFTLPYLYYSADLGPRTGFVYTGLCLVTWAYVYFCVGEVTGRSFEEIDGFFRDGIPARKWAQQPRASSSVQSSTKQDMAMVEAQELTCR